MNFFFLQSPLTLSLHFSVSKLRASPSSEDLDEESKRYMYATIIKGLVKSCVNPNLSGTKQASDLMIQMEKQGVQPDVYVYSQLMDHLIRKRNDVDAAHKLFQQMQKSSAGAVKPNVVVYNILLRGYCNQKPSKNGER